MRLLLFNPETEYALASGASFYTPPARVESIRRECQLLPEAWADPGDVILVDDTESLRSRFRLVSWDGLGQLFERFPDLVVDPWGWNPALIRRLKDAGVPPGRLPDQETMSRIRSLAHRRTTLTLNSLWNRYVLTDIPDYTLPGSLLWVVDVPLEFTSIGECMGFYRSNPGCWMKAPWSSSGRGVINTAADMTDKLVEQWCRGILRRQGSVMGESGALRMADFATEWRMSSGEAVYSGLSCFSTSRRGKYIANESIPQEEMKERFDSISLIPMDIVVSLQKKILQEVLKGYEGPCGVDMLIERDGHLRPFVELNLRRTMGMIYASSLNPSLKNSEA